MKKALSVLLCLVMLLSLVTVSFATSETEAVENTLPCNTVIESGERYYISTIEDLKTLAKIVNEDGNNCDGANFWLNNDIVVNSGKFSLSDSGEPLYNGKPVEDCAELITLESIGKSGKWFKGSFIGNGYTISGLYNNALFGYYSKVKITNLCIKNSYVTSNGILGNYFSSSGYIRNCSIEGIVNSESDKVGIFAGTMLGTTIRECYAQGYVSGNSSVGGFAGHMSGCEVSDSMSNVQVKANSTAGGFAGKIYGDDTVFEYCSATGKVNCADETAGQFVSSVELYYFDDGYDILRTLNISYAAVETNNDAGFCYEFTGDSAGVNQCYYMSEEDGENGFATYTEEEMKTTDFVDVLHADIFAQLEEYPVEWGYFGIYFVGKDGKLPVPYGLHTTEFILGHDFGKWEMDSTTNEKRYCKYHACDTYETRAHTHSWGEYVYNNDAADDIDGTKTAYCKKDGCVATDTVADREHLRLNTIPITENATLEKGKLYTISGLKDWKIFTEICKQDTTDISFALVGDITVNEGAFTLDENNNPLYNGISELPESFATVESFNGTFDGLGYTLSGLYLNSALFENCNSATIKNINIVNSLFADSTSEFNAAICSSAENSTFENCYVNAYVIGNGKYTGGLVGNAIDCTADSCRNEGTVVGTNAGGLVGYTEHCALNLCCNEGTVIGNKLAGGLAVYLYQCDITYCYNSGDVSANTQDGSAGSFAYYICGSSKQNCGYTIKNCYTAGNTVGCHTGKFCAAYSGDIFAMSKVYFEGNDILEADSDSDYKINEQYQDYLDYWEWSQGYDDGYYYPMEDTSRERLGLYEVSDMKADWCPQYIGGKKFVGDADNSNRGYPQFAKFHKHVWSDYVYDEEGADVANCLCYNCDITDEKRHSHSFAKYVVADDKTTETAICVCGETSTQSHSHTWGEYSYNEDANCEVNGTKTATCTANGCGIANTINDPQHPATDHSYGEWETVISATADIKGNEERRCQNCTSVETRTIPTLDFIISDTSIDLLYKESESISTNSSTVTWSTTDSSVAVVDEKGNITAVGRGDATITATNNSTGKTASCEVTVTYAWWQWIIRILLLGFLWY